VLPIVAKENQSEKPYKNIFLQFQVFLPPHSSDLVEETLDKEYDSRANTHLVSRPRSLGANTVLMFSTAFNTPLPP